MKKILIVEPSLSGHHMMYLRYFSESLLQQGYDLTVLTSLEFKKNGLGVNSDLNKLDLNIKTRTFKKLRPIKKGLFKYSILLINSLLNTYNLFLVRKESKEQDLIFFCYLDEFINEFTPLFIYRFLIPIKWTGLFLNSKPLKRKFVFEAKTLLKHPKCIGLGVLGDLTELSSFKRALVPFPDFTDESNPNFNFSLYNEVIRRAGKRKIISLLGSITYRKGVINYLNTINEIDEKKFFFLIAGETPSEISTYIFSEIENRENCFFSSDKIPSEGDFNSLISCSNIIYAAYVDFKASSNLLTKASIFKKPIIVSKGYYMQRIVEEYQLGISVEQSSSKQTAAAVRTISSGGYLKKLNPKFNLYSEENSLLELQNSLSELIKCAR